MTAASASAALASPSSALRADGSCTRSFRYQLALGSLFWLVGIFALSFAHTFWQIFLSQAVCMGLALGIFFSPCLSILGTYFRRRRAFVVGIAASGTAVGAVIFPVLLGQMLEKSGFPWAIRAGESRNLLL